MINEQEIYQKLLNGTPLAKLAKENHVGLLKIREIRDKYNIPKNKRFLHKALEYPNFIDLFKEIYNNSNSTQDVIEKLSDHPLFETNSKRVKLHRYYELRDYLNLPTKMPEINYNNKYDRIKGYIIRNTKFSAKRRGLDFDLTYEDIELPEYCPLLGIKLTYFDESNGNDYSHASLDRIDNSKGYIKGNVWVISKLANAMKNCATFDQLNVFCENISKLNSYYKVHGTLGSITDVFDVSIIK